MTLRFGTDGVRGVANSDLTPELVVALGRAAAEVLSGDRFLIGRDTRRSGPLLEAALAAGLASGGADVELLGVVPTPAVAWLAAAYDQPAAMISASHNPFPDNGIKLFSAGGRKLDDRQEAALEAAVDRYVSGGAPDRRPTGTGVGEISHRHDELDRYVEAVVTSLDGRDLTGMRVVVDVGHGAAIESAPAVLGRLGAEVIVLNAAPDGTNINRDCGSTAPERCAEAVIEAGADAGLAFDGDADRVIAVAGDGSIVDGDRIMAICGVDMHRRGELTRDTLVVTVMSNLGFVNAMGEAGIDVVQTAVGDRHVLEALEDGDLALGGEQSGHVILRRHARTGDGVLAGVHLLDVVARAGRSLTEMAAEAFRQYPQELINVEVADHRPEVVTAVADSVAAVEARLGADGRVLLRPSGTEPVVRVMVEAADADDARQAATELAAAVADAGRRLATR